MDTDFHTEIEEEFYRNFDQRVTSKKYFVVLISVFVYALHTHDRFLYSNILHAQNNWMGG